METETNIRCDTFQGNQNSFSELTMLHEEIPVKDSRELHEPQLEPRFINYINVGNVNGQEILSSRAVDFPLNPDTRCLENLSEINEEDNSIERLIKLIKVAGSDANLLDLIIRGVRSGLSHGTMDIIYRVGAGDKVGRVLDNLDIAVGSLQRRVIVSDIIGKTINEINASRVFSIAGGSCLLPIEGIYQSGHEGLVILNVDKSEKANEKAIKTLKDINDRSNIGLALQFVQSDILNNGLDLSSNDREPEIIECTGFWEYLNKDQRESLLQKVSESMGDEDVFILTALVNNPQQKIFDAIKFKKLSPHKIEDILAQIGKYFHNTKMVVETPNGTYATLVLKK